jgi:hypothetical protein
MSKGGSVQIRYITKEDLANILKKLGIDSDKNKTSN